MPIVLGITKLSLVQILIKIHQQVIAGMPKVILLGFLRLRPKYLRIAAEIAMFQ